MRILVWWKALLLLAVALAVGLWIGSRPEYPPVPACKGEYLSPGYSPNRLFYYRMYVSNCDASEDTRSRLEIGRAGSEGCADIATALVFSPPIGTVRLQWRGDSELQVTLKQTVVAKRFDLPPEWAKEAPRIVIDTPAD